MNTTRADDDEPRRNHAVSSKDLAANAVTADKLAANAVTAGILAARTFGTDDLRD